jgi:hypothetical protein
LWYFYQTYAPPEIVTCYDKSTINTFYVNWKNKLPSRLYFTSSQVLRYADVWGDKHAFLNIAWQESP